MTAASWPADVTPGGRRPALTLAPTPGRADCPHCGERVEVLTSGRLAFHYAHGPGMGIPCPTARRCWCGRPINDPAEDACGEHA